MTEHAATWAEVLPALAAVAGAVVITLVFLAGLAVIVRRLFR